MNLQSMTIAVLLIVALAACRADSVEGRFLPACTAYAGDSLTLDGGRYTWDKFTDEVKVDADGNAIDQFPGYPRSGSFDIDNDRLVFAADDGNAPPFLRLARVDSRVFLLTTQEFSDWQSAGEIPACALVLQ